MSPGNIARVKRRGLRSCSTQLNRMPVAGFTPRRVLLLRQLPRSRPRKPKTPSRSAFSTLSPALWLSSETTLKDVMLMLIDEQNKKGGLLGKKLEAWWSIRLQLAGCSLKSPRVDLQG